MGIKTQGLVIYIRQVLYCELHSQHAIKVVKRVSEISLISMSQTSLVYLPKQLVENHRPSQDL